MGFLKILVGVTDVVRVVRDLIVFIYEAAKKMFRKNEIKREIKKTESSDEEIKEAVTNGDVDKINKLWGSNPNEQSDSKV